MCKIFQKQHTGKLAKHVEEYMAAPFISGVDKTHQHPILQTKHKHTFELH